MFIRVLITEGSWLENFVAYLFVSVFNSSFPSDVIHF
jgi:hypothetical protein